MDVWFRKVIMVYTIFLTMYFQVVYQNLPVGSVVCLKCHEQYQGIISTFARENEKIPRQFTQDIRYSNFLPGRYR